MRPYLLALSAFCALLLSQPAMGQTFKAAIMGGGNLSQLDGDRLHGYHRVGATGGLRVNTVFSERWQLGIEMHFTQQGAYRVKNDVPSADYRSIRLNYAEVPLLLHFKDWKFLFYAGGSYARLINYRVIARDGTDGTDQAVYDPNAFSMIFGATLQANKYYGFDLRWSKTFNGLQADPAEGAYIGRTVSLRALVNLN